MNTLPSAPADIDLSAVDTLTDDDLVAALLEARRRFAAAKLADPRRYTLTYSDARLAVNVLSDEQRRRHAAALIEQQRILAAVRPARPVPAPVDRDAPTAYTRRLARAGGDVFATLPAQANDDLFGVA